MPIDFTFSQEVEDARLMVRDFLHNTVKKSFDANSIRLIGNVRGEPPFQGTLRHRVMLEYPIELLWQCLRKLQRCLTVPTLSMRRRRMKATCTHCIISPQTISGKNF